MASRNKFEINGVIDTSNNVLDNIELLATSSGCFVTWNPSLGKWVVIVNEPGASVKSFTDSNILGSINVGGSGVNELYNSVLIEYPHKDLRDATDYLTVTTPTADRFAEELDNQLNIKLDCINDPVQAQIIATQELKQNRIDKIIQFASDFTANGLKAGDLIDVTAGMYDYTNKVFRVIQIEEQDDDDGAIVYNITALEYDADVYVADLTRDLRTKRNGVVPKIMNQEIQASDDIDAGASIGRLLLANAAAKMFNSLLGSLFGDPTAEGALTADEVKEAEELADFLSGAKKPPLTHSASTTALCEGGTVTITLTDDCETCYFDVPDYEYPYTITGIDASDISIPLTGVVQITSKTGSIAFDLTADSDTAYETLTFTCGENSSNVVIQSPKAFTYDSVTANPTATTEGGTSTITIATTGIADGTTVPYTISGSASSKVTSPSLSGTVTITSGGATIDITTNNDGVYTGGQSLTFTLDPGYQDPCAISPPDLTADISVADDETAPPYVAPDNTCQTVTVPVAWCGSYDPSTNYLKSLSSVRTMTFALASAGGTAVPSAVSVTSPGTSSAAITVDSTVNVDPTSGQSGIDVNIITSFATPSQYPDTRITGTTSTLRGY
jgi:hypothetical protein|tara:strand:+ start:15290 stop:17134 length:1845 start_codon:yes stop_codon:yes gene_type:complete